jgi:hypothetical protein
MEGVGTRSRKGTESETMYALNQKRFYEGKVIEDSGTISVGCRSIAIVGGDPSSPVDRRWREVLDLLSLRDLGL